jgi:hypothetical protein
MVRGMSEGSGGDKRASIDSITRALADEVEPGSHAYWQYHYVLTELGHEAALDLVQQVHAVEAAGGMPIQDGSRRRTPGGVFFALAYERLGPKVTKSVRGRATRRFHEEQLRRFLRLMALLLPPSQAPRAAEPARPAPTKAAPARASAAKAAAPKASAKPGGTAKPSAKVEDTPKPTAKVGDAPKPAREPEPVEVMVMRRRPLGAKPGSAGK